MADDPNRGLYGKYEVNRIDGKPIKGGRCIVLEVGDPNTWRALWEWADTMEDEGYRPLADDVRALVEAQQTASRTSPGAQPPSTVTDEGGA